MTLRTVRALLSTLLAVIPLAQGDGDIVRRGLRSTAMEGHEKARGSLLQNNQSAAELFSSHPYDVRVEASAIVNQPFDRVDIPNFLIQMTNQEFIDSRFITHAAKKYEKFFYPNGTVRELSGTEDFGIIRFVSYSVPQIFRAQEIVLFSPDSTAVCLDTLDCPQFIAIWMRAKALDPPALPFYHDDSTTDKSLFTISAGTYLYNRTLAPLATAGSFLPVFQIEIVETAVSYARLIEKYATPT